MKQLVVNKAKCIGCGPCQSLCGATFTLGDDGKAQVSNPTGNSEAEIQGAIDACPTGAISWTEE